MTIPKTSSRPRGKRNPDRDKKHMGRVAALGCCLCGAPAEVHHLIEPGRAMSRKASDYETIPLCLFHHRGEQGIHVLGTRMWEHIYGSQRGNLTSTMFKIYGAKGMP